MKNNRKGAAPASTRHVRVWPIAFYTDGFAKFLAGEGYVLQTVKSKCSLVADLGYWLKRRGSRLAELDERTLKQLQAHRSNRRGDVTTSRQLLEFLRGLKDICTRPKKIDRTALGQLTRDYERFLSSERSLAPTTVIRYVLIARRFLTEHFGNKALRLRDLRPPDLHRFVLREVRRVSRAHGGITVTALRSFLRFLRQRGMIETDLAAALFGVARW